MATETGFQIDWLNERFKFDCKARNQTVEKACLKHFKHHKHLNIVDIGAGTGSNCLYLMERFPQNQIWTFVELNPELNKAALTRLQAYGEEQGYKVLSSANTLNLSKDSQTISIRILQQSFLDLEQILELNAIDLLTAGAVFDLLSKDMLEKLLGSLLQYKVACLSTINYEGMKFAPSNNLDLAYIGFYESHVTRTQPFGKALGLATGYTISNWLTQHQYPFVRGDSHWHIGPEDQKMHDFLLNYMQEGVTAVLPNQKTKTTFQTWLDEKRVLARQHQLQQIVYHSDFFFHP